MAKTLYVIKYDLDTELYLQTYNSDGICTWGSESTAVTFTSMEATEPVIALIGSGPIGVPKKKPGA